MELTDDERDTLLAEADLLDRVVALAPAPGRVRRSDVDDALRAVGSPGARRRGGRVHRVPAPRPEV